MGSDSESFQCTKGQSTKNQLVERTMETQTQSEDDSWIDVVDVATSPRSYQPGGLTPFLHGMQVEKRDPTQPIRLKNPSSQGELVHTLASLLRTWQHEGQVAQEALAQLQEGPELPEHLDLAQGDSAVAEKFDEFLRSRVAHVQDQGQKDLNMAQTVLESLQAQKNESL